MKQFYRVSGTPPVILSLIVVAIVAACQPIVVATPAPAGTPIVSSSTPTPRPTNTPTPTATPSPTPSPTPTPTRTPTPAPTSSDLEGEGTSLSGEAFKMTLTEKEINELAQDALATQSNVPVSDVSVRLEDGQVVARGRVRVAFLTLNAELIAIVPVENGKPAPEIVGIKVNGQPISGVLRTQIMNMITPYLDRLAQADLAVDVEDVQITPGRIRVVGRYK